MQPHRPVMLAEVLAALKPQGGGFFVDGTVGAGGHAHAVLTAAGPEGRLLGLDRDPVALDLARQTLAAFGERAVLIEESYHRLEGPLLRCEPGGADGILLDLGVSSMQLDNPGRGFSFMADGPLDMRMGTDGPSAAEVVAAWDERELAKAFAELGEEPFARRIAAALVRARGLETISTTGRLAELVSQAIPAASRHRRKRHPATRVFQALRIVVNQELERLAEFMERMPAWLAPGGRLCVISYHSLEDRLVKKALAKMARPCTCPPDLPVCACGKKPLMEPGPGKPLRPSEQEVADNPRARSARLRWATRTAEAFV